jgi:hypothetical protein
MRIVKIHDDMGLGFGKSRSCFGVTRLSSHAGVTTQLALLMPADTRIAAKRVGSSPRQAVAAAGFSIYGGEPEGDRYEQESNEQKSLLGIRKSACSRATNRSPMSLELITLIRVRISLLPAAASLFQ